MSEQITEVAKAAAEGAKCGTKALDVTEKLYSFIGKVFKEPIEATSGIVGDCLKLMRWKRQVRIVNEVQEILKRRNINDTRAVPPKFALPLLEQASLEEDNELQDLWNRLLANAMDPSKHEIKMSFIEILKNLTPLDAKLLQIFHASVKQKSEITFENLTNFRVSKEELKKVLGINELDYQRSANNLMRVRCIAGAVLKAGIRMGNEPLTIDKGTDEIVITILGYDLVESIQS